MNSKKLAGELIKISENLAKEAAKNPASTIKSLKKEFNKLYDGLQLVADKLRDAEVDMSNHPKGKYDSIRGDVDDMADEIEDALGDQLDKVEIKFAKLADTMEKYYR